MTDATVTDMAPFYQRYDRRQRLVFVTAICASLVLSAIIFKHGVSRGVEPAAVRANLWGFGILFAPVFIVGWQIFTELLVRWRRRASSPNGRHPAGMEDARNGMRIANRGFVFNVVVTAAVIMQQAIVALLAFGYSTGDLIPRATCVAVGAVSIYLGNLWPRMPTPRAPPQKAAIRMKANRFAGWLMVIVGLLIVLLGLFLPLIYPLVRAFHAHG